MWALKARKLHGNKASCCSAPDTAAGLCSMTSRPQTLQHCTGSVWLLPSRAHRQLLDFSPMWLCTGLASVSRRYHGVRQFQRCCASVASDGRSPTNGGNAPQRQIRYSPLHLNIEDFARRIVPTEEEKKLKYQVIEGFARNSVMLHSVKQCVKRAFESARQKVTVEAFGSLVSGLSTWNSDVDMVVTGIMQPVQGGFTKPERQRVSNYLDRVAMQLRRSKLQVSRIIIIRHARIPIIKMRTRGGVTVDISLGDDSGPKAARFLLQQVRAYPPVRPLVLVLKTLLKLANLNEVASGGLSSYSLTNMVIAHLQAEQKDGHDVHDLGETLYGFLLRFGEEFNYETHAVSVTYGGIVLKSYLGLPAMDHRVSFDDESVPIGERLVVDDPLTGRDISAGTYRIDLVRLCFQRAARKLQQLAAGRSIDDTSINYLTALFDPVKMCRRRQPGDYADDFEELVLAGRQPGPGFVSADEEDTVYDVEELDEEEEELEEEGGAAQQQLMVSRDRGVEAGGKPGKAGQ